MRRRQGAMRENNSKDTDWSPTEAAYSNSRPRPLQAQRWRAPAKGTCIDINSKTAAAHLFRPTVKVDTADLETGALAAKKS